MKKLVMVTLFGLVSACPMKAQEVFNQVVSNAKLILEDPNADPYLTSVSQFKYTALQYLCNTAIKRNGGSAEADMLDRQAYAMNNFIMSYLQELAKAQKSTPAAQKNILKKYWRASAENPMFYDEDKETTEAFMSDPKCITPFCLDTDWEKANEVINKK